MSYIFDCDGFEPTANGGIFRKGRRRLAFGCQAAWLTVRIADMVRSDRAFHGDALPENVILTLCNAGVLRQEDGGQHGDAAVATKRARRSVWQRCDAAARETLPTNAYVAYVVVSMAAAWARLVLMSRASVVILQRPVVEAIARPWARLASPGILCALAAFDLCWLALANPMAYLVRPSAIALKPAAEQLLIAALMCALMLAHEFAHAAASINRTGGAGQIRFGRMFLFFPYLFTTVREMDATSKTGRLAIAASGSVVQMALSAAVLAAGNEVEAVRTAAALSALTSLFNLLPIKGLDGYWIACDVTGQRLRLSLRWSKAEAANACYTMGMALLLMTGILWLHAFNVRC